MPSVKIGFYGMTHLGLVSAVAAAAKGYAVICYDHDQHLIEQLQQQCYPINEPNFEQLLQALQANVQFTASLEQLIDAELIYVAIDVPTDSSNQSQLAPIRDALQCLKPRLRSSQVVVVLSQVAPGFMRSMQFPAHQLYYQVETLIFGRAIERASHPERLIIGCANPAQKLPEILQHFLQSFNCPILTMRYESAELTKVSINMYLVASVMTSNTLADLAAAIGADWEEVVPALRLDKRIGEYAYLNPGLGISGGNLERDMVTILQQSQRHQVHADLVKTWLDDSEYYKNWVFRCLKTHVLAKHSTPVIAVLGLAYKANTHSIKNSPALQLLNSLKKTACAKLITHDPVVKGDALSDIVTAATPIEALNAADVVIVMTPWPAYAALTVNDFLAQMQGRVLIDPHHVYEHADFIKAGFSVYTLGVNYENQANLEELTYA